MISALLAVGLLVQSAADSPLSSASPRLERKAPGRVGADASQAGAIPPRLNPEWSPAAKADAAYWACAAADAGSTLWALNTGRFREGNGLLRAGSTDATVGRKLLLTGAVYGILKATKAPPGILAVVGGMQCAVAGINVVKITE